MSTLATGVSRAASSPGPVRRGERIDFLDTARGFALLGILFVNIQSFGEPFGRFIEFRAGPGLLDQVSFAFVKILCEGKFYTLFSTLFGIGLAIQWSRAHEAGRTFRGLGFRRLLFLFMLGLAHGLGLWYGDILMIYSICGLLLLPMLRFRPGTLITIAAIILGIATLLSGVMNGLMQPAGQAPTTASVSTPAVATLTPAEAASAEPGAEPAPAADASPAAEPRKFETSTKEDGPRPESPVLRLMDSYRRGEIQAGPDHPIWMEQETRAFKDGPFFEAFSFRVLLVGIMLVFTLLGFGWSIIAMFMVGAAMWKSGFVAGPAGPLARKLAFIGLPLGVAGSAAAFAILQGQPGALARIVMGLIAMPSACLIALGYFCGVKLWVEGGRARGLAGLLANVGRFGLTNYILQTVICTFVFYHWGLAKFSEFSRPERMALVVGVYVFQVVLSAVLARVLAYGPLEWVWRTATYLRPQPFLKAGRG